MNITVESIKRYAQLLLPPQSTNGLNPARDERAIRDLLIESKWGRDWKCTSDWNKYEKWDIEGFDDSNTDTKIEVKSRPLVKSKYDTWIIDMYKVDFMLNEFTWSNNLFVNACDGKYHVYDMRFIQGCYSRKNVLSWMENGTREPRNFYYVPKDMFLIELSTGEIGAGSELNGIFNKE